MYKDSLIFGKNELEKVVSWEVNDGHIEVFIEENGSIKSVFIENKHWILCSEQIDKSWVRLKGDLHYKWGKQFKTKKEWLSNKGKYRNKFDIYSIGDNRESALINRGITYFKGMTPKDVSILSFDIETTGIKHNDESRLLIIANTFRSSTGQVSRKLFAYDQYEDEGKMIEHWVNWVRKLNPTILCGHNILSYDFPYIKYIADRHGVSLDLGRDKSRLEFYPYTSKFRIDGNRDQDYTNIRIYGREIIDTMFLAIRYDIASKKYESYGLKNIIKQEGLEVENRQHYDAATIKDNFTNPSEWDKIKRYAQFDGDDALALFDLMIPSFFYFNQSVPKTFQQMILSASGSQLNSILVRSYLQNGHSIPKGAEIAKYPGAISYGNAGIHRNVMKVDVASLYPSIILQYEIYDKEKDPNANFLKMVQFFTKERLNNKKLAAETGKQYYKDLEQAQKIGINSAYGLLGASGLNFNNRDLADQVTRNGREILQKSIKWAMGRELIPVKIPKKTEKGKDKFLWLDPVHFNEKIYQKVDSSAIVVEDE